MDKAFKMSAKLYKKLMENGYTDIESIKGTLVKDIPKLEMRVFKDGKNDAGIEFIIYPKSVEDVVKNIKSISYRPSVAPIFQQYGICDVAYVGNTHWAMIVEDIVTIVNRMLGGNPEGTQRLMERFRDIKLLQLKNYVVRSVDTSTNISGPTCEYLSDSAYRAKLMYYEQNHIGYRYPENIKLISKIQHTK